MIEASPQGHELKGIIYKLKEVLGVKDPIASNYVIPSSVGDRDSSYNVKSLVLWNANFYGTSYVANAWIQLTFPKRYIFPTAYSLKGYKNYCHAKSWNVYGIHEGDENKDKSSWDLLGENDTTQSPYCNPPASGCASDSVGTLTLKPLPSVQGYRSIRWMTTENSASCRPTFMVSAVDVYGILTNVKFIDINIKNSNEFYMLRHLITALMGNSVSQ